MRKLKNMGFLGALGFVMLFQYQNCAPVHGNRAYSSSSDDGIVTTIDDVNLTAGVAFVQSKVQVSTSDQPTIIDGACSMNQGGAVLGWKVKDADGHMKESGYAVCDQGKFQVEMSPSRELNCEEAYQVTAQLNAGQAGQTELTRDCTAQASN